MHLSACKCVHRWSITGRDAADCRMFIGHRISCYSAYYYGTMDRVAWRREKKKKREEKKKKKKRRERLRRVEYFFFSFFFFLSSGRRFPCPVAQGTCASSTWCSDSIGIKMILSEVKRLLARDRRNVSRDVNKSSHVSRRLNANIFREI